MYYIYLGGITIFASIFIIDSTIKVGTCSSCSVKYINCTITLDLNTIQEVPTTIINSNITIKSYIYLPNTYIYNSTIIGNGTLHVLCYGNLITIGNIKLKSICKIHTRSMSRSVQYSISRSALSSVQYSISRSASHSVQYSISRSTTRSVQYSISHSTTRSVQYSISHSTTRSVQYSISRSAPHSTSHSSSHSVEYITHNKSIYIQGSISISSGIRVAAALGLSQIINYQCIDIPKNYSDGRIYYYIVTIVLLLLRHISKWHTPREISIMAYSYLMPTIYIDIITVQYSYIVAVILLFYLCAELYICRKEGYDYIYYVTARKKYIYLYLYPFIDPLLSAVQGVILISVCTTYMKIIVSISSIVYALTCPDKDIITNILQVLNTIVIATTIVYQNDIILIIIGTCNILYTIYSSLRDDVTTIDEVKHTNPLLVI